MSENKADIFERMLAGGIIENDDPQMKKVWAQISRTLKLSPARKRCVRRCASSTAARRVKPSVARATSAASGGPRPKRDLMMCSKYSVPVLGANSVASHISQRSTSYWRAPLGRRSVPALSAR